MSLPSRKERRKKNKRKIFLKIDNLFTKAFLLFLLIFNCCLIFAKNIYLLSFTLPIFLLILILYLFKGRKLLLFFNIFLLLIMYFSYLEISFRFWAEK